MPGGGLQFDSLSSSLGILKEMIARRLIPINDQKRGIGINEFAKDDKILYEIEIIIQIIEILEIFE